MAQIIIKKTGIQKKAAMGGAMVPCRSVYVYQRGRRFGSEVEVLQQQRWCDDKRWLMPTLNWCAASGGALTIKQAEAFREVLDIAIVQAKQLSGKPDLQMGDCPTCGNTGDTETVNDNGEHESWDDDGRTAYHECKKCGCEWTRFFECQFVFDNVEIIKEGKQRAAS